MAFATNYAVGTPYGTIAMWYGAVDAVPNGWHLCDGAGGTPDLRDRFIVGAGNSYAKGASGGEASHALIVAEIPGHTHAEPSHTHNIPLYGGANSTGTVVRVGQLETGVWGTAVTAGSGTGQSGSSGGGGTHENRPPYYALAYIMKV